MSLTLERRLADRFVPGLRRELFDALMDAQRNTVSLEGGLLKVDLREPRGTGCGTAPAAPRTSAGHRCTRDIGGEPGLRARCQGIRSRQSCNGANAAELRQAYPRLTPEMVRAAPLRRRLSAAPVHPGDLAWRRTYPAPTAKAGAGRCEE